MDRDADKRKRLKAHSAQRDAISEELRARGYQYPPPSYPPLPDELADLTCGAKTRAGTPCKRTDVFANGRCKWHGGCSTGPKTEAGKEQARVNGKKGGRPRKTEVMAGSKTRHLNRQNPT